MYLLPPCFSLLGLGQWGGGGAQPDCFWCVLAQLDMDLATKHICRVCHTLSAELLRLEDAVGADVLWLEMGMWWFL